MEGIVAAAEAESADLIVVVRAGAASWDASSGASRRASSCGRRCLCSWRVDRRAPPRGPRNEPASRRTPCPGTHRTDRRAAAVRHQGRLREVTARRDHGCRRPRRDHRDRRLPGLRWLRQRRSGAARHANVRRDPDPRARDPAGARQRTRHRPRDGARASHRVVGLSVPGLSGLCADRRAAAHRRLRPDGPASDRVSGPPHHRPGVARRVDRLAVRRSSGPVLALPRRAVRQPGRREQWRADAAPPGRHGARRRSRGDPVRGMPVRPAARDRRRRGVPPRPDRGHLDADP